MKQLLISFSVAIIGLLVLTHEAQLVQSKAIQSANSTNATNASAIIVADLAKNLSQALELIQNLTHKLEHVTLNQTNASIPANASRIHKAPTVNQTSLVTLNQTNASAPVNASKIHSAPLVNQTQLVTLNQTNASSPVNASRIHKAPVVLNQTAQVTLNQTNASSIQVVDLATDLSHALLMIQNLTHQLEHITLNQTNASSPVNGSRIHSAPLVNQTQLVTLNQTNASSPVNASRIHSAPTVHQTRLVTLNQTNSTGPSQNSSSVPVNATQIFLLTLQNSQRIDALAQNVSRLASLIFSLGSSRLNQTQNSTQNSSRIIHFPVVSQHLLTPLNGTNSTGPAQNATGPAQNATRVLHQAPVVIASNATAVNATQVHQLNQTQAIAQNLTHLQEVIGNLTQQMQQIKLF